MNQVDQPTIRLMEIDDLPVVFHTGEALFTSDLAPVARLTE